MSAILLAVVSCLALVPAYASGYEAQSTDHDRELGRALYTNCVACHGEQGQGGFGPPLSGNANLEYADFFIAFVARGSRRMPSFEEQLSRRDMAAVLSYVRNSWGNAFGPVTEEEVIAVLDTGG